jgi:hypothetical protein
MRLSFLLAAAMAVPAAAQPGSPPPTPLMTAPASTTSPAAMLPSVNRDTPEDEEQALARAASAHPLGTVENPIRVGGPEGEHTYLARLRCADGTSPRIGSRSEAGIGAFGTVVSAYALQCGTDAMRVVFDMYHEEHVEDRAPPGFTLAR